MENEAFIKSLIVQDDHVIECLAPFEIKNSATRNPRLILIYLPAVDRSKRVIGFGEKLATSSRVRVLDGFAYKRLLRRLLLLQCR